MINNNIVETIQKNLGYLPLQKVDPNSQEIKDAKQLPNEQKLPQAAIPAVLAGLIKFTDKPEAAATIFETSDKDWLEMTYGDQKNEVVRRVAVYSGVGNDVAESNMKKIADEAVMIVRSSIASPDTEKLRTFMNAQRHNILGHLPAVMKVGDLLNEESFDDRTNKMEGPVSGFMHRIENII